MRHQVSRRFFLGGTALCVAAPGLAAPPAQSLRPSLRPRDIAKRAVPGAQAIIARAGLAGHVCYSVADAKTGQMLEAGNGARGTPPASVSKALTALYALETLGAEHRFTTRLIASGSVTNGVLQGDLVLAGGGDPTLDTNALADLAAQLKAAGIREVRGRFKVATGPFPTVATIDPEQPDHVGYSPAVSGIALNFNRVHFEWRRGGGGYSVTMDARSQKYRPEVAVARMQVADRRAPVYTYRDGGRRDEWSVARGALGTGGARWLPVRKPALYAGDVFQTFARSAGVALKNPQQIGPAPQGTVVGLHQSAPLRIILRDMLKFSTNVTAEMVGLAASIRRGGTPKTLKASARQMSRWAEARFGAQGFDLVDHSGLGGDSRMTSDAMVQALVKVYAADVLRPILKEFQFRDPKGRPQQSQAIQVQAKTGTLHFVSGLAGYATARDGRVLAFAIFAADPKSRATLTKANRERPPGARSWNRRAKALQQALIERWDAVYQA